MSFHYSHVIMNAMASQITGVSIVCSSACSGADQRKHGSTGLCEGNPPVTSGFPSQRVSDAENVSIWWRHHTPPFYRQIGFLGRMVHEWRDMSVIASQITGSLPVYFTTYSSYQLSKWWTGSPFSCTPELSLCSGVTWALKRLIAPPTVVCIQMPNQANKKTPSNVSLIADRKHFYSMIVHEK